MIYCGTHMYIVRPGILTSIQSASNSPSVGGLPFMLEFPSSDEWQMSSWAVCVSSSCVLVLGGVTPSCWDGSQFHSWDEGEDVETWRREAFSPCSSFCRINK